MSVSVANGYVDDEVASFLAELEEPVDDMVLPGRTPPNLLQDFSQEAYHTIQHLRDTIRGLEALRGYTGSVAVVTDLETRGLSPEGLRGRLQSFEHRLEVELLALQAFLFGHRG
jgi:hypothetical protein